MQAVRIHKRHVNVSKSRDGLLHHHSTPSLHAYEKVNDQNQEPTGLRDISLFLRLGWGPPSLLSSRFQRPLPRGKSGLCVNLTTHLRLINLLGTERISPLLVCNSLCLINFPNFLFFFIHTDIVTFIIHVA
jgi:hypothetical protein